jgi:glutamate-1-semialdehyde 2,1-aminomutase
MPAPTPASRVVRLRPLGQDDPVTDRLALSKRYVERANAVIPGGAHTYAKGHDQYPEGMAPVMDHGDGCRAWDIDGNEYVEYGIGSRGVILGHNHPAVLDAVSSHLHVGTGFVRPHQIELEAAEHLAALWPHAEMVKFGVNGSDATSAAVRLARAYTGRDLIAVCRQHPMFSTDDWFIGTTAMPAGVPTAVRDLTIGFTYNDLDSLEAALGKTPSQVAAVILEAETTEPPSEGFLAGVRELCDRHGVVLVLDEIITGFRWHLRGAQYVHDLAPDLSTFGKGLANGFPLSALVGRREIMRLGGFTQDRDRVFMLSQTYGGQPWVLAAMIATIHLHEREDVARRLDEIGGRLRSRLECAVTDAGLSEYIQLLGRNCNMVYVAKDATRQPSQAFRTLLLQGLLRNGVLAPSLVVSTAHDDRSLEVTTEAFESALRSYGDGLERGVGAALDGRPVQPALRSRG